MNEHPILFSTPMVQANLEGRKTNTRRMNRLEKINHDPAAYYLQTLFLHATGRFTFAPVDPGHAITEADIIEVKCPYGQPGDLLWVRETSRKCDDGLFAYKADYSEEILQNKLNKGIWRPSIHMPKTAARIWSQVEEIRVERLQDISEEDAIAEGITSYFDKMVSGTRFTYQPGLLSNSYTAKREFEKLWCKINGEESWEANPWVWVVKYKILSTTGRP